jgi:hypothetical protein
MKSKRSLKKRQKRIPRNEWLSVVTSLDLMMAEQVSEDSPKERKPVLTKTTLDAVNAAYAATLRYYTTLLEGGKRDPLAQREISQLWQKVAAGIKRHDPDIANRLKASNEFWTNDVTWEKETIQKAWAALNSIRISANTLSPDLKAIYRWSTFSSS